MVVIAILSICISSEVEGSRSLVWYDFGGGLDSWVLQGDLSGPLLLPNLEGGPQALVNDTILSHNAF